MSEPLYYQKEDVMPYMRGMWRDALQKICGLSSSYFSKRHGPCPHCHGKDRFRWTDKVNEPGDGGAFCSQCGASDGIGWLMKLTGEPYSECVNILGRFLGKEPVEYVVKQNKRASSDPGYKFGANAEQDKCLAVMERTVERAVTPLTLFEALGGESYSVGVKALENGAEKVTHVVPCYLVSDDGPDDEPTNLLFIDSDTGEQSFYARNVTYGSVTVTGQTDKAIYLVTDWIIAEHVHFATKQEVWNCFNPANLEIVASRYKGDRQLRVACNPEDMETLYMADDRDLKVLLPNPGGFKQGAQRKLFEPSQLIQ